MEQQAATLHELKTWPEYFTEVWEGRKSFEVRKDDRGFKQGDSLLLREYDPKTEEYTGRTVQARISYILRNYSALLPGYVVLALWGVQGVEE